jgi:hypothetical protein
MMVRDAFLRVESWKRMLRIRAEEVEENVFSNASQTAREDVRPTTCVRRDSVREERRALSII